MSLATRCTACGTVFRVVQDQLKVSEGWVRCGRCNEVFNALEGLFDLERDAPPEWRREPGEVEAGTVALPLAGGLTSSEHMMADKVDSQLQAKGDEHGSTPAARVSERDRLDFPDARFEPEAADEIESSLDLDIEHDAATAIPPVAIAAPPQFVRRAERQARWTSPAASIGMSLVALLLCVALALQAGHHFRDLASARWPALRPGYLQWCELMRCTLAAPQRIDSISVETTALTRDVAPDAFRLSVLLRNHGDSVVALPSIDLSLTDPSGTLVARRVLAPQPVQRNAAGPIAPGGESALQWILSAGSARVTGYTVEIFYP
jgi:predicted Zn finger-like uncharacterized protein